MGSIRRRERKVPVMPAIRPMLLPFAYHLHGFEPRRRTQTTWTLRASTLISVPELTGEEAPRALTLSFHPSEEDTAKGRGPRTLEYREYEGRLYVPIRRSHGESLDAATFERDAARPSHDWRSNFGWKNDAPEWRISNYPHLPIRRRPNAYSQDMTPLDLNSREELGSHCKREISNDRAEREIEARQFLADNLIVIDGDVWTTSLAWEPVWQVRKNGHKGLVEISGSLKGDELHYLHQFRIDRLDDALAYAEILSRETGHPTSGPDRSVEIHRPQALRRNSLEMIARQALSSIHPGMQESWPDGATELHALILAHRSALRQGDAGGEERAIAVVGLLSRFKAMFSGMEIPPGGREFHERTEPALHRFAAVEAMRDPSLLAAAEKAGFDVYTDRDALTDFAI